MSNRLAFQTQLASIMEVLANAAVAEICKLVDDDYAVVSVQMSQCQRENKALKRKLHLLELKMARGFAERRLRDSATNNGRPRVHQLHHLGTNDKFRGSSSSSGGVFERQVDMGLWPGGPAPQDVTTETAATVVKQDTSADVELVEPEEALVKQERMEDGETGEEELEEVQLIGEDGQVERGPLGGGGRRAGHLLQDVPAVYQQKEAPGHIPGRQASTRGVEVSGSSPLLKPEPGAPPQGSHSLLHTPPPLEQLELIERAHHLHVREDDEPHFDAFCDVKNGDSLVAELFDEALASSSSGSRPSCSYSMAATPFPSTSGGVNGWGRGRSSGGSAVGLPKPPDNQAKVLHRTSGKERLFVCSFCGKAFNRPKKVEIHQRIHTGEKPFRCPTCGKTFSEAGNLKKHQRVHSGEKAYSCNLCGKRFAWIRNLKAHQQKSHADASADGESWGQNFPQN